MNNSERLERYKSKVVQRWTFLAAMWTYVLGYVFELYMRYFG